MFKEAPIARCLRLAFVGGLTFASVAATAQTTQESSIQKGERVEVTGSNIRRVQSETASPVQTLSREDIDRSGKTSVAELLQSLAVDNAGSVPATFGNGFSAGSASGISLRGLGVGATLVLVNGRRVAAYPLADDGTKTFTDLNIIPLEAVERVEILKDGGSAVYGSDAIAGVVNIILRREFNGLQGRVSVGQSLKYGDGRDTIAAITGGFGNLDSDGYNVLGNFEYRKKEPIQLSNRRDRGRVGITDLRSEGFTSADTTAGGIGAAGTGAILSSRTTTGSSIIGNVRNPATNLYYSRDDLNPATGFTRQFPGAACAQFTDHAQGDPNRSCLIDATQQYGQVIPKSESFNLYTRGSFKVNENVNAYVEGNLVVDRSRTMSTPTAVSGNLSAPGFGATTQNALLGAAHPDNPYFGQTARLRYLATDLGGRTSATDSEFDRILFGLRGTQFGWDFDTAVSYSRDHVTNTRQGYVQSDVLTALLNPTAANQAAARATSGAYAALPAGTYYRIGENAGLNSSALYAALSPQIQSVGDSKEALIDFKASREVYNLPGGPLGVAIGAEARHESVSLTPTTGTERANVVGLGYSAYGLTRNVQAAYGEVVAPVIKQVELSAAARYDHYQYAGGAFNPKAGIKITPIEQVAIRGTYTRGFRAPNAAESGGGTAAFSTSTDPVRCSIGFQPACSAGTVAILTLGNTDLKPERSETYTAGFVLDPTRSTTISADYFVIRRKNEIIGGSGTNASNILAGNVTRDPTNVSGLPGDPGALVSINNTYVNSSSTKVRGLDLDLRQDVPLGAGMGKLSFGLNWTHLFGYQVIDNAGELSEYAGSHGNCNTTNCIGTPADRVNAAVSYVFNNLTVSAIGNFRSALQNRETKNNPDCETVLGGNDLPMNCRVASFTTFDLTARWQATRNWEVFGSIQNIFDKIPPYDPTSYGAVNYNPLDFQGAVGRFFVAGARYKF